MEQYCDYCRCGSGCSKSHYTIAPSHITINDDGSNGTNGSNARSMGTAIINAKPNDATATTIVPRTILAKCYDGRRYATTTADIRTIAARIRAKHP